VSETSISRRRVLASTALALAAWTMPRRALAASPVAATGPDGFRVLTARPASVALAGPKQPATPVWSFDGTIPGPLLRVRRGDELRVRFRNGLPEPSTIHWHGVRVPNAMDGTALVQRPVPPGDSFDYRFTPPDAGTFWYHAPLGTQIDRGLSGMLVVEETSTVEVDREVALAIGDWRLRADGSLAGEPDRQDARAEAGSRLTVNGNAARDIPVRQNERLRLRLLNTTRARLLAFAFGRQVVTVMALDGQPSEPFTARENRIALGPGNRVDLFLDVTLAPGTAAPIRVMAEDGSEMSVRLVCESAAPLRPAPLAPPKPLPANALPQRMDFAGARRHDLRMENAAATASAGTRPEGPPLFTVKRNRTVALALDNRTDSAQAVHVHGHHFRLLDRLDDGWKPFWLDTLVVPPRQTWRIAFVADNPGKWMIDVTSLRQADADTGVWFEVT
jgi:FtsP/CotA-like multicopper oxidase with cupredoxin domain